MVCVVLALTTSCAPSPEESPDADFVPATIPVEAVAAPPPPTVFDAVADSDLELLQSLHAEGRAIDILDDDGLSPLHHAVMNSDLAMATLLLDLGLDPNGAPSVKTPPLNLAIDEVMSPDNSEEQRTFAKDLIKLLMQHGANPTAHHNGLNSAVQHAMDVQCEDCVTLLREQAFSQVVN